MPTACGPVKAILPTSQGDFTLSGDEVLTGILPSPAGRGAAREELP